MRSPTWMTLMTAAGLALAASLVGGAWAADEATRSRVVDPSADRVMQRVCAQWKSAPLSWVGMTRATAFLQGAFSFGDPYIVAQPPTGTSVPYLPNGYEEETIGGTTYMKLGPTYYRPYDEEDEVVYVLTKV